MRGHVFETHQERGAAGHLANQYETTMEHLIEYVGQHLSEKHAGTVMVSILENMKEPIATMPLAPTDPMLQINRRKKKSKKERRMTQKKEKKTKREEKKATKKKVKTESGADEAEPSDEEIESDEPLSSEEETAAELLELSVYASKKAIWQNKINSYENQERYIFSGKTKVFVTIWSQCSPNVRSKLEALEKYEEMKESKDIIELLKQIKKVCLAFEMHAHKATAICTATKLLYDCKQSNSQGLLAYYKTFKSQCDVLDHYGGAFAPNLVMTSEFLKIKPEDLESKQDDIKQYGGALMTDGVTKITKVQLLAAEQMGVEGLKAALFLQNSNGHHYDLLQTELQNDLVRGSDGYPTTLQGMYHTLLHYKHPTRGAATTLAGGDHLSFLQQEDSGNVVPGRFGRLRADIQCMNCQEHGHFATDCPTGNINMVQIGSLIEDPNMCFTIKCGDQELSLHQGHMVDPFWIILDSGSTVDFISNESFLRNITESDDKMTVWSVGGSSGTDRQGYLPGYDQVWTNPSTGHLPIAPNVLSLANITKKFRVTQDSAKYDGIHVHLSNGRILAFKERGSGLFYYDATPSINENKSNVNHYLFVTTVAENLKGYTKRQIKGIEVARRTYEAAGYPSHQIFTRMITQRQLPGCPATLDDAENMLRVYGPNVPALKGKTTRRTPGHVASNQIVSLDPRILTAHKNVTLCVDIFFVDQMVFLLTVSRNIRFYSIQCLSSRKMKKEVLPMLKQIRNLYHHRGFKIVMIHADPEFEPLRDSLIEQKISLNICGTNEHVPEAERGIRTCKERNRTTVVGLPYKRMPKLLKRNIVLQSALFLNLLPHQDGVSEVFSPRTIVTGIPTDFNKQCRVPIGAYCEVYDEPNPSNTETPRTTSAIALRPVDNLQGSYSFMSLETGARIVRRSWKELPVTKEIIDQVHALADAQMVPVHDADPFLFEWAPNDPILDLDPPTDVEEGAETSEDESEDQSDEEDDDDSDDTESQDEEDDEENDDDSTYIDSDEDAEEEEPDEELDEEQNEELLDEEDELLDEAQEENEDETTQEENEENNNNDTSNIHEEGGASAQDGSAVINSPPGDILGAGSARKIKRRISQRAKRRATRQRLFQKVEEVETAVETVANDESEIDSSDENLVIFEDEKEEEIVTPLFPMHEPDVAVGLQFTTMNDGLPSYRVRVPNWTKDLHKAVRFLDQEECKPTIAFDQHGVIRRATGVLLAQMTAKQGIKQFGNRAVEAIVKEFSQINDKGAFRPRQFKSLTPDDRKKALRSITLVNEKRDGRIKGRTVADGRPQRKYYAPEDIHSPTVSTEGLFLSLGIDAKEGRDVATCDVEGAYLHAKMEDHVIMVFEGEMVDYMVQTDPKKYSPFIHVTANGTKLLYVQLLKALYGCIQSAMLWWKLLTTTLVEDGFVVNPYDPCVANKQMADGTQCTICWYVDDLKVSHINSEVVDEIIEMIETKFGKMTVTRGRKHVYLGMDIEFTGSGEVQILMQDYIQEAIDAFPEECSTSAATPGADHLFKVDPFGKLLKEKDRKLMHSLVAKLLFVSKRARPDIQVPISFLTSRVTKADEDDWKKLKRLLQYLQKTIDMPLTLSIDNLNIVKTWVDAAFAVHDDMRSHTGGTIMLGKGTFYASSKKQKLNTKSSTEAELVGAGDFLPQTIWTSNFLKAQGYTVRNDFHQDNQSSMRMEKNGRKSAGPRSRHIDIRYFFIKDRIEQGEINLIYCPSEEMVADFFSKPLQGGLFRKFRDVVMGITHPSSVVRPTTLLP